MRNARRVRERLGLGLETVVRQTSLGLGHLQKFEVGKSGMGIDKLQELAAFYGCTIDELVADAEPVAAE